MTGICAEPGHSEHLEKSKTNVRPWSPLRAASSSGSDGWATAAEKTGEDRRLLHPCTRLLPPPPKWGWLCLPEWSGVCCSGGTRKERREGRGGSRAPAPQAPGQSQGGSISSPALGSSARPLGVPSWPPNRLFTEPGQRAQNTLLRHQLLLIPFPRAQAGHWGARHVSQKRVRGKELQTPSPAHKPEVICRSLWALSADWGA